MRSASALVALVREIVDEPVAGLSDVTILSSLNEALGLVAEKLTPTTLVVSFEELDVSADEATVALPDLCIPQKILSIHNSDHKEIKLYKRLIDAKVEFQKNRKPEKTPQAALVSGGTLVLIPKTTEDSVVYISYIKKPELYSSVSDDGSSITFLPDGIGEKYLVNYASAMAYRKIEDGVTDDNGNFKLYYELAMNAMNELEIFFGPEARQARPEIVSGADEIAGPHQASDPFLV